MSLAIRELALADEAALRSLMNEVVPGWVDHAAPEASGPLAFLADRDSTVLGAYVDDQPVAWAWGVTIRGPNGRLMMYLHELDVVPAHQRQGIATMLVEASISLARQRGCAKFWLTTSAHNDAAQSLYESVGGERSDAGDVTYWWSLQH